MTKILLKYTFICGECANSSHDDLTLDYVKSFKIKDELYKYISKDLRIDYIVNMDQENKDKMSPKFNKLLNKYNKYIDDHNRFKYQESEAVCDAECGSLYIYGDCDEIERIDLSDCSRFPNITPVVHDLCVEYDAEE